MANRLKREMSMSSLGTQGRKNFCPGFLVSVTLSVIIVGTLIELPMFVIHIFDFESIHDLEKYLWI